MWSRDSAHVGRYGDLPTEAECGRGAAVQIRIVGRDRSRDPITPWLLGRSQELRQALSILGLRRSRGLLLCGARGVRKAAFIDELSWLVHWSERSSETVAAMPVASLEIGEGEALRPGEGLPGLRGAIEAAALPRGTVLVIEELPHLLAVEPASTAILSELGRTGIRVLGTASVDGRGWLDRFARKLGLHPRPVMLPSLAPRESISVCFGARTPIEDRYGVRIAHSAVVAAVGRCVAADRPLPGAALDLLDAAACHLAMDARMPPMAIESSRQRRERLLLERESIVGERRFDVMERLDEKIADEQRHLSRLEAQWSNEMGEIGALENLRCRMEELLSESQRGELEARLERRLELASLQAQLSHIELQRARRERAGETLVGHILDEARLQRFVADEFRWIDAPVARRSFGLRGSCGRFGSAFPKERAR